MKTLFFVCAFVGFIYLVIQSTPGQAWLQKFNNQETKTLNSGQVDALAEQLNASKTENKRLAERLASLEEKVRELTSKLNDSGRQTVPKAKALDNTLANNNTQVSSNRLSQNTVNREAQFDKFDNNPISNTVTRAVEPLLNDSLVNQPSSNERNKRLAQQAKLQDVINKMELTSLALLSQ